MKMDKRFQHSKTIKNVEILSKGINDPKYSLRTQAEKVKALGNKIAKLGRAFQPNGIPFENQERFARNRIPGNIDPRPEIGKSNFQFQI